MIQHRGILLSASMAASAAFVFLFSTAPIQAHTKSASPGVAEQVFRGHNLSSRYGLSSLQSAAAGTQETQLPEGEGRELVQKKCNTCHASTVWTKKHYTEDRWTSVMDQMAEKGMSASDEEIATMTRYLAANFGPPKKDVRAPPTSPQ